MPDFTYKLLVLPEKEYELVGWEESSRSDGKKKYEVTVRYGAEEVPCAYCGVYTDVRYDHSTYVQKGIHHLCTHSYDVHLTFEKRRWFCSHCEKGFVESIPLLARATEGTRRRSVGYTTVFEQYICDGWALVSVAALSIKTELSESCVWSIIEGIDLEALYERGRQELLSFAERGEKIYLAIDEHSRSGREMLLSIIHHRTGHVIAVLPDTKAETLTAWINSLPPKVLRAIQGVTTDMNASYLKTVVRAAGLHVIGIVDHFHVIQLANRMMEETRDLHAWMMSEGYFGPLAHTTHGKRAAQKKSIREYDEDYECTKYRTHIPEELSSSCPEWKPYCPADPGYRPVTGEYYLQEKYRTLFVTGEERLTPRQRQRIEQVFTEFDPHHHLADAYSCKERVRDFFREKDPSILDQLLEDYKDTTHYKLKPFLNTIRKWLTELKAYCTHTLTNALAEGKITKHKLFKRAAYGYKTTKNYAKKLMWVQ